MRMKILGCLCRNCNFIGPLFQTFEHLFVVRRGLQLNKHYALEYNF